MSKWLNQNEDGTFNTTIADAESCAWMYNEVCCNDQSDACADFPSVEFCEKCKFFTPEEEEDEE